MKATSPFMNCTNQFEPGGPNVVFNRPNLRTLVKGVGDENYLFRYFSYIITSLQDHKTNI